MNWVIPFDWNPKSETRIEPSHSVFFLGSCFAENIANKMIADKFNVCLNPFGILYNPYSMAKAFEYCLNNIPFDESQLFFFNDFWHSEMNHGEFSDFDKKRMLEKINSRISNAHNALKQSHLIFLTFGTSKVYLSKRSGEFVGNCHKRPASDFDIKNLSFNEITESWKKIFVNNPNKTFYLSISPVRYLREGLIESNNNKAKLRIAVDKLVNDYPNVHYFPAYELVIDVLRDYRFYDVDLVHPNAQSIDFVYDFFSARLFSNVAKEYVKEWRKIYSMLQHRALNPDSLQWKEFERKRLELVDAFENKWKIKQT